MKNGVSNVLKFTLVIFLWVPATMCKGNSENKNTSHEHWYYLPGLVWKKKPAATDSEKKKGCENTNSSFDLALTSGYVWKRDDDLFKEVYGHGIFNIATVDGCYYPCTNWGLGAKIGFWQRHGKTTCFQECTRLKELPLLGYVRARIGHMLQAYASLGAGVIFAREKSYLGCAKEHTGIAEVEIGATCNFDNVFVTGALDFLFPKQPHCKREATTFGGYGLRGGIGISF
jgi:hypothetical protein